MDTESILQAARELGYFTLSDTIEDGVFFLGGEDGMAVAVQLPENLPTVDALRSLLDTYEGLARRFDVRAYFRANGRKGGLSRSPAKVAAVRKNGLKGGRPRKGSMRVRKS